MKTVRPPWLHVLYAAKTSSDRLTSLLALDRGRGRGRVRVRGRGRGRGRG